MILKFLHKKVAFFFLFILIIQNCFSQTVDAPDSLTNKQKTIRKSILVGTTGAFTAVSLVGLNQIWYKQYASSKFHFFNDNSEW